MNKNQQLNFEVCTVSMIRLLLLGYCPNTFSIRITYHCPLVNINTAIQSFNHKLIQNYQLFSEINILNYLLFRPRSIFTRLRQQVFYIYLSNCLYLCCDFRFLYSSDIDQSILTSIYQIHLSNANINGYIKLKVKTVDARAVSLRSNIT